MANPKKIKAKVKEIIPYGDHVYKVVFETEKKFPKFKAGQFLHLTIDDFDPSTGYWPESRVFSIASCTEDRKNVAIVYSVKGVYTKKMEKTLEVGTTVWLKAPYGEFIIQNSINQNEDVVLIAGGTGLSPFIPFLSQMDVPSSIQLHYGIRNKNLLIFEDELNTALESDTFTLTLYLENMDKDIQLTRDISFIEGVLSVSRILGDVKDVNRTVFFISGPPAMIESFQKQLAESGITKEKIIVDEWG